MPNKRSPNAHSPGARGLDARSLDARTVIAVDSSTEYLQIALWTNGRCYAHSLNCGLKHTEQLMPQLQSLLVSAGVHGGDIGGLVCARGPGGFTGLRIAMSSLKGMARAWEIPLVSLSVLDSIALQHWKSRQYVLSAIDARRKHFYVRLYNFSQPPGAPSADASAGAASISLKQIIEHAQCGPPRDCGHEEIGELLVALRGTSPAEEREGLRVVIAGPHGEALHELLAPLPSLSGISLVPLPYSPWIVQMLELGREYLQLGIHDSLEQGPEYIRAGL